MHWMHWMSPYGGGWYMMGAWWPLILVFIALGVWFYFRQKRNGVVEDSSMEMLRRRYASGEISREEFEEKKRHLA